MLDFTPTPAPGQNCASPRILGLQLIRSSGARLLLASSRLGGEEGAALACAFRDMVIDFSVHPLHWPIEELLGLLRKPAERQEAQVEQLIERLEHIRHQVGRPGSDPDA